MGSLLRFKFTSSSSKNKGIMGSEYDWEHLKHWKLPKIPINEIYKQGIFTMFGSSNDYEIQTIEQTIPLDTTLETVSLFDRQPIGRHRQNYRYLHLGSVQVAVKPLHELGPDKSILLCLRDRRLLNFDDSLLGGVESSLCDGPLCFNCFPDYSVSLTDPHILRVLTLNIKTNGFDINKGSLPMVLIYRVSYKLVNSALGPKYIGPTGRRGECTTVQANIHGANIIVPKVKREQNQLQPEVSPSEVENKSTYQIVQNAADSTVEFQFSSKHSSSSTSQSLNSQGVEGDMPHENTTRIYKIKDA